jgi:hypothetical protein
MSAVIAFDFVEHILERLVLLFGSDFNVDLVRRHSETLITVCTASYLFSPISPCLVASACILTTLRPCMEARARDMPSPCSAAGSPSSPVPDMDQLLDMLESMTSISKVQLDFLNSQTAGV